VPPAPPGAAGARNRRHTRRRSACPTRIACWRGWTVNQRLWRPGHPVSRPWTHHPNLFELLILLFDRSEFLAESAIRTPDLIDELVLSDRLRRSKTAEEVLADLRYGLADADQRVWGAALSTRRSSCGSACGTSSSWRQRARARRAQRPGRCVPAIRLEIVLRQHRRRTAPFALIGLGKLGGREIDYGSDLDLVFVADPKTRNLFPLQPLALEVMDLLAGQDRPGRPVQKWTRGCGPTGKRDWSSTRWPPTKSITASARCCGKSRPSPAPGPLRAIRSWAPAFQILAARLTNFRQPSLPLAAYEPGWKATIARMRARIEKERTPPGQGDLAIKTGAGD